MEETDKDNEIAKNTDASIKNTCKNILTDPADYLEALCKSVTMSKRDVDSCQSNMFLQGDQLLYNKEKMLKSPGEGFKRRPATSVKSDRVSDDFSTENKMEPSELSIRNFQARNTNNKPQRAKAPFINADSGTPYSISDFMNCSKKTSESDSDIKLGILNISHLPRTETITSISSKEFSDKGFNSSTKDRVEDASLDCNSQTTSTASPFSDSDSNAPSSHLKISERDLEASTMMFTSESPKRFRSIKNRLNFSDKNLTDFKSETSTNSSNYCQRSKKRFAACMTNDEDGDCLNIPLKSSKGSSTVLDHTFLNIKSNLLEVLKTSYRNLESYDSDLNFPGSDKESEPDTRSPSVVLKELQNLIGNPGFQDIDQQAATEAYSDMEHTLSNYQGTSVSPYVNIENEMSTNISHIEEEYDSLNIPIYSGDGKTAAQNYLSDSSSIRSKVLTFPCIDSKYCSSDLKFSDSDTESYHSELMFSDSDKDSNPDKQSEVSHVPKELKNIIDTTAKIQGMVREEIINIEEFSNIGLSSDNDRRNFDSADETKENEVSAGSMSTNDEYEQIEALVCSEDPTTALENYLSDRNSIPSEALTFSSNVLEYCHSDFKSSDTDRELKPKKQSLDFLKILKGHGNLMKTYAELHDLYKEDISSKRLSKRKLLLGKKRVAFTDSDDTMRNEMSVSSMNNYSFHHFLRLGDFMSSKNEKLESKDYFPESIPTLRRVTELSGRDSNIYQSDFKFPNNAIQQFICKESMREEISLKAPNHKELRIKNAKFSVDDRALDKGRITSIGCVETRDSNLDTLVDIFNTVIKCQPIKKFEIPPYESTNDGRSLGKSEDNFTKYACNATELYGIDEHRNILQCFSDTDSDSVLVFDVTDCFSQNSSIICDSLIKEYLNTSAKINLLLIKKIKDTSTEEYELRIRSLHSLDDELGYVIAKLITTINDWAKQFNEINQNISQSRIGGRGLHHMGILRTCLKLISILLNFSLEKQLKLEDYENCLIFHHRRSN